MGTGPFGFCLISSKEHKEIGFLQGQGPLVFSTFYDGKGLQMKYPMISRLESPNTFMQCTGVAEFNLNFNLLPLNTVAHHICGGETKDHRASISKQALLQW